MRGVNKFENMEPLEEQQPLVHKNGFKRIASCFRQKVFKDRLFHGGTMGAIIGLTMNEAAAYSILRFSAELAEIPSFVKDVIIVMISVLETLLAPLIGWWGQERRVRTMVSWLSAAAVAALPLFFLGFETTDWTTADLCNAEAARRSSDGVVYARLAFVVILGLVSALARVSIIAHGVAGIDDFDSKNTIKDLGIVLGVRVFVLVLSKAAMVDMIRTRMWLQVLGLLIPLLIKGVILWTLRSVPPSEDELTLKKMGGRDFFRTLARVLNNPTAVRHAISAGVIAAAVWGFAFHNEDLVRAKYLMVFAISQAANQADFIRMLPILMMIIVLGYQLAAPTALEFDKLTAVKKTVCLAAIATVAAVVLTLIRCSSPRLQGLEQTDLVYQQPSLSYGCGCAKSYNSMFPVCSLTDKTTYFSPCHAGCERRVDFHGTNMLTSCRSANSSAPPGEAFEGVCNGSSCYGVYSLHQVLFVAFLTVSVMSILLHCMLVLRSVDARDKSLALGVTSSAVALLAFVAGHLLFTWISHWTCAFADRGFCHIHNWRFQYVLGGATVGCILISAAINVGSLMDIKRRSEQPNVEL